MKLDFKNAFNSVRRDKMLTAVRDLVPMLFPFIHSVYSSPSLLFWGDKIIQSSEGVQQGDPLGSLLFCLSIHHVVCHLKSELCIGYIDDLDVQHDVDLVECEAGELGLVLNHKKSEIITNNPSSRSSILAQMPDALVVEPQGHLRLCRHYQVLYHHHWCFIGTTYEMNVLQVYIFLLRQPSKLETPGIKFVPYLFPLVSSV